MERHEFIINFLPFLLILIICSIYVSADEDRQVYIVYMGSLPKEEYTPVSHHYSLLQQVTDTSLAKKLSISSYKKSFNGFAANITSLEAQRLHEMDGVVSVFPSKTFQLQTTRSWSFIGFDETAAPRSRVESDLVIGVIDTGIWPELASFSDEGFGPPPKRWNGTCDGGKNFTCNKSRSVGCIDSSLVKGKIVLCDDYVGNEEAIRVGARGSIMARNEFSDVSFVVPLPALALRPDKYQVVIDYINSTNNPTVSILKSVALQDPTAPTVVSFSSRGPNISIPDIMKPDISAPGVDILAAFAPNIPPTSSPEDKRSVKFNILSGTSMACPHAAAVAAYVKSFHPDWPPSAIKSAIMTTASPMNATNSKEAEFAYGSGQINPVKAVHPGLVYEASVSDYLKLLCANGYTTDDIKFITGENVTCPTGPKKELVRDHNYPSMTATVATGKPFTIGFHRTVANVGLANSTYKAKYSTGFKLDIKVVPDTLSLKSLNQKQSFNVTVRGVILTKNIIASSSLVWSDCAHSVRSPVVLYTIGPQE